MSRCSWNDTPPGSGSGMPRKSSGLRRKGPSWQISYYDQWGRRRWETVGPSYRDALRAREHRLADVRAGRFGWERQRKPMTLAEFVNAHWKSEVAIAFKPSTLRVYEVLLQYHILPAFGDHPLLANYPPRGETVHRREGPSALSLTEPTKPKSQSTEPCAQDHQEPGGSLGQPSRGCGCGL
jgi:hypothetical protein